MDRPLQQVIFKFIKELHHNDQYYDHEDKTGPSVRVHAEFSVSPHKEAHAIPRAVHFREHQQYESAAKRIDKTRQYGRLAAGKITFVIFLTPRSSKVAALSR